METMEKDKGTGKGLQPFSMTDFAREAIFGISGAMAAVYRQAYGSVPQADAPEDGEDAL